MTKIHFSSLHPRVTVVMVCEREPLVIKNLEMLLESRYLDRIFFLSLPSFDLSVRELAAQKIEDLSIESRFETLLNSDQWFMQADYLLSLIEDQVENRHLVFFLGGSIELTEGCLDQLVDKFLASPDLVGINPMFLRTEDDNSATVAYLGMVFDSQKRLHFLYEGVASDHPVVKPRTFQLAHFGALLLSYEDFRCCDGFSSPVDDFNNLSLCFRLTQQTQKRFLVDTDVHVWQHDRYDSWNACGLLNSFMGNGRLELAVESDYASYVHADGYHYGVTMWLEEVPLEIREELRAKYIAGMPASFPCWHDPLLLSNWLLLMTNDPFLWEMAVVLAGNLPYFYPHVFAHYEALAERILEYARKAQESELEQGVLEWLKNKRRFHYETLHKTMEIFIKTQLFSPGLEIASSSYDTWQELVEPKLLKNHGQRDFTQLATGPDWPCLCVAMPVYKAHGAYLQAAVASVKKQSYPHWQLCMVDDASGDAELTATLEALAASDERIRFQQRENNGGISRATNTAVAMTDAPYVGFMDQDDLLAPEALAWVAQTVRQNPQLRFLYSDEDVISEDGIRRSPTFRTSYFAADFIPGHLMVYETEFVRELHGFRPAMDGAQDYDLALRAGEVLSKTEIGHIPRILYHWRLHPGSTNMNVASKPYVVEASQRVLEASFQRRGLAARACETEKKNLFLTRLLADRPSFSVIVTFDQTMTLDTKMVELLRTLYDQEQCEIIFLAPPQAQDKARVLAQQFSLPISLQYRESTDRAYWLDVAKAAQGEILLWLSAYLLPMTDCRPQQLVSLAACEGIGLVGGAIWSNGTVWHMGFYPDENGVPFPLFQGLPKGYQQSVASGQLLIIHRVLAPSKLCFAVKRELFCELGGLDPRFTDFSEVDLSLRLEELGYTSLVSPWGQWTLSQSAPLSLLSDGIDFFQEAWGAKVAKHALRHPCLCHSALGDYWQFDFGE